MVGGGVEIVYREEPTRIGEFRYFRKLLSNQKAYIDLGWTPTTEMEDGVRRTVDAYKAQAASR
jgi:nucleoside-diphosphate-sugar epimerase